MMHTFKTSSSTEITALIKKHGTIDALFIKNLSYFTNVALKDIDETGIKYMKTGVRYIVQGLMDNTGLTKAEYTVLTFWSNQLAGAKVPFLTARAHTLIDARGDGSFSKHDLDFICFVASAIKAEVASTNKTLAEFVKKDGDILNMAYEVTKRREQAPRREDIDAAMARFAIRSSQLKTLAGIEGAISDLECVSKDYTSGLAFAAEQLQLLHQKREALKK